MKRKLVIYYQIEPNESVWTIAQKYQTSTQNIEKLNPKIDLKTLQVGQVIKISPPNYFYKSNTVINLIQNNQNFWIKLATMTYFTISSCVKQLPSEKHFKSYCSELKPFYGESISNKIVDLLKENLRITFNYIKSIKSNQIESAHNHDIRWHQNALNFVYFLCQLNPYISPNELKHLLFSQLKLIKKTINNTDDDAFEIDLFDELISNSQKIATILSNGIISQFHLD